MYCLQCIDNSCTDVLINHHRRCPRLEAPRLFFGAGVDFVVAPPRFDPLVEGCFDVLGIVVASSSAMR